MDVCLFAVAIVALGFVPGYFGAKALVLVDWCFDSEAGMSAFAFRLAAVEVVDSMLAGWLSLSPFPFWILCLAC